MKFAPFATTLLMIALGSACDRGSGLHTRGSSHGSQTSSDAETRLDPSAGHPVETLAWADAPFFLWPEALSAAPVRTDSNGLRALICLDRPALEEMVVDDPIAAMAVLCDWSAEHLAYAADPWTVSLLDGAWPDEDTARIYFDVFEPGVGGVYCGGSARFLQGVLRLFEYDAATICFGINGTDATHVAVLVAFARGSGERVADPERSPVDLYLLDPTFNATFVSPTTARPLTLRALIAAHARGASEDDIAVVLGDLLHRRYIRGNPPAGGLNTLLHPVAANQRFVISAHERHLWPEYWRNTRPVMEPLGIDVGVRGYLQLLGRGVLSVDRGGSRAMRARLHELCVRHGLPHCLADEFDLLASCSESAATGALSDSSEPPADRSVDFVE